MCLEEVEKPIASRIHGGLHRLGPRQGQRRRVDLRVGHTREEQGGSERRTLVQYPARQPAATPPSRRRGVWGRLGLLQLCRMPYQWRTRVGDSVAQKDITDGGDGRLQVATEHAVRTEERDIRTHRHTQGLCGPRSRPVDSLGAGGLEAPDLHRVPASDSEGVCLGLRPVCDEPGTVEGLVQVAVR